MERREFKNNKKIRIVVAAVLIFSSMSCFAYGGKLAWERREAREKLSKLQEYHLETEDELQEQFLETENVLQESESVVANSDEVMPTEPETDEDITIQEKTAEDDIIEETERATEEGGVAIKKEDFVRKDANVVIPIDFEQLQAKNPDIYAWITVPGTKVDYPIVQREGADQEFYLDHGYEQEPNYYGAIYTENLNGRSFTDPMTVIYGHNMKDGTMFQTLHSFENPSFFKKYRKFIIYTPKHKFTYLIYAAYSYEAEHLLKARDYWNKDNFQDYLDKIYTRYKGNGNFVERPKATVNNRIVTLSTCIGNDHSQRYLVQGLLTKTE